MTTTTAPPRGQVVAPAEMERGFAEGTLFDHSAWRLELLDWYTSPATERRLARFLAGEQVTPAERAPWLSMLHRTHAAGKTITRVRVITEPLTDYLKYELACFESSVEAGEDIRILPGNLADGLHLPEYDFWLFDAGQPGARAAVSFYGERGAWLRAEIVTEPGFVAACCRWRDAAMSRAIPFHAYQAGRRARA
jgi:hypothetical protein